MVNLLTELTGGPAGEQVIAAEGRLLSFGGDLLLLYLSTAIFPLTVGWFSPSTNHR